MKTFDEIKAENFRLAHEIDKADREGDFNKTLDLKKTLYTNKLTMIELLTFKNKKISTTARALKEKVDAMKPAIRYETGLSWLDTNLKGGFEVGSLIILAGESGSGKSHVTLDILSNIAEYSKCMFFNFEMGDRRIVSRLKKLLHTDSQWDNLLIDSESRDVDDLIMEITLHAEDGIKFFVVDSKMKLNMKGSEAEYQKISAMSRKLSELAIKNDIIVFLINQISEDNLKNKRLALKGSGDQVYDADMVLYLTVEENGVRQLSCTKNRQDEMTFRVELPMIYAPLVVEYEEMPYLMPVL